MEPEISDLSVWEAPQTADNFYRNFNEFLRLANDEQTTKMRAQYLYSHIVSREQWKQAKAWIGPDREIYTDEAKIPSHLLQVVSYTAMFPNFGDFSDWCEENIRGFSWTTYRDRHYIVEDLMRRGHDMKTACEYACLSRSIPRLIGKIFIAESERMNEIVGVDVEMAKRLPTLSIEPDELENLPVEEQIEIVKEAARLYDLEKLASLQEGVQAAAISAITRREIERTPLIEIITPYDAPYPYAIECTEWSSDDTGYGEGDVSVVYIQLISRDGEVLDELPEPMATWWLKKFGLGGPHGSHKLR